MSSCTPRAPAPPPPLDDVVQSTLQELLSVAGLHHEDSWDAAPAAAAFGNSAPSSHPDDEPLPAAIGSSSPADERDLPPAAALRLYQARLQVALGDLTGLQAAVKARDARLAALEREAQQLRLEKAAWLKQRRSLEAAADKGRRAAEEARARAAEQENALKQVALERRASQQERRQAESDIKAREAKLAAALEEAQRLRRLLEEAKAQSGARAGVSREEHGRVVADNRQLAGQKQELLVALKKAGRLIDVLRRQKVCLEAAALLQVSSRELADALAAQSLDWL